MKSRNEEPVVSLDDTKKTEKVTLIVLVFLLGIYLGFKTNSIVYGLLGGVLGWIWGVSLPKLSTLLNKWDKHKISQKLPDAITNFFRRNPRIRRWLGLQIVGVLFLILSAEFLIELITENFIGAIFSFSILILIIFVFYLISIQYPNTSGKVVQFDEALRRLSVNEWDSAQVHFEKAVGFFREYPVSDAENCIKDSICVLEACLEVITHSSTSSNFNSMLRQIEGIGDDKKIPPTIAEGLKKLYAYRGDASGVAHANPRGSQVSEREAELVLNLTASYVVYLSDLYGKREN